VTDAQPPIIDVRGLADGGTDTLRRAGDLLRAPCETWGLFHLVGHGVPPAELAEFGAAMKAFFELPSDQKALLRRTRDNAWGYYDEELTKNRPDWKEVFDYGAERRPAEAAARHSDGVNRWPSGAVELRRVLLRHHASCEWVALGLLRALCVSLGLESDVLAPLFEGHSSFVRLNRYAPCPEPAAADAPLFPEAGHLGVHHHTDAGALTVLYQDEVPGLQAFYRERWHTIEPVPGAFTVNLGDMLQVWSNDRYRSPLHRVIVHRDRARCSAPFFLNPSYESVCEPLPGLLGRGARPRFRPISWSHFRDQRSAGDFADYGAEIQIDDYRVDEA
jgi:isopenicillin N synthase-like dioxygenase